MEIAGVHATASATVQAQRFVKITGDFTVAHAGAGEEAIGVTTQLHRKFDDADHAETGEQVSVQTVLGSVVRVEAGGNITAGDLLESDANGKAVSAPTTGTNQETVVAQALQDGADGEVIQAILIRKSIRAALS